MRAPRAAWPIAGILAGVAGLAVSHAAAMLLGLRSSPVAAMAEAVIEHVPGTVAAAAIQLLGKADKPVLVATILLVAVGLSALAGRLARTAWWGPLLLFGAMGGIALLAVTSRRDATATDPIPVVAGVATWIVILAVLADALRRDEDSRHQNPAQDSGAGAPGRRSFLVAAGVVVGMSAVIGAVGSLWGGRRRAVEDARRLLRLPVSRPWTPDGATAAPDRRPDRFRERMPDWNTPTEDFYLIHTALAIPAIHPDDWSLRIHGMVERELRLDFADLVEDRITEQWVTLNCVSNPVGGPLIGNAWWSGVLLADLLARAGVQPGADAVLQTSHDGWTCGTPLTALTDPDRTAMLAIAMNGAPLTLEHGFPVRTLVPGLYGYVSACKWVVDLEVTRFQDFEAYWTTKGWSVLGPVKISSRIDVPHNGKEVASGTVALGGHAWSQHTGIARVQVAVDGGAWTDVELAGVPNADTWVQWWTELDLAEGEHTARVRAVGVDGEVQTGARTGVVPDGATGWHEIGFTAT